MLFEKFLHQHYFLTQYILFLYINIMNEERRLIVYDPMIDPEYQKKYYEWLDEVLKLINWLK